MTKPALVVWAFIDGKAGHENQTRGLLNALAQHRALDVRWLKPPAYSSVLTSLMAKRFLPGASLPSPDLIVGAGHRTHLPMIAARRARGGKSIVLMKPSLPHVWFDLCIVPEHDAVSGVNIIPTRGAINTMQPGAKRAGTGLILIGGPSRHHGWRENEILSQVEAIVARERATQWLLTTSRRTPASTTGRLLALGAANLRVMPVEQTGPGWLATELATAASAWVTEDSVSMVYESLTAGCATGVLAVPPRRGSGKKIRRGLDSLLKDALVTAYAAWQAGAVLRAPAQPFNEAARIANWIDKQWLAS